MSVLAPATPDDRDIGLWLVVIGNPQWVLFANVPARGRQSSDRNGDQFARGDMARLLGHFSYQQPANQLDLRIIKDSDLGQPLVPIHGHSVEFVELDSALTLTRQEIRGHR